MQITTLLLQVLLSVSLLLCAFGAAFRPRLAADLVSAFPQRGWGRALSAALFAIAGMAVLAGSQVPFLAFFASVLALVAAVVLAILLRRGAPRRLWPAPALVGIAAIAVALLQPLGLRVLALPAAADLPFNPSDSEVLNTYDAGLALEGIAAGADGTLYIAGNRGLDFSRADYYAAARGELIARTSDGKERIAFTTPAGTTAGVPAVASDGSVFLTSHGKISTIWRIGARGANQALARFPEGAWPNGLAIGPDGMLYSPDSTLGVIWRVDPASGKFDAAVRDPALLARRFIALAPGANGIAFQGRDLLVTVSDRGTVLRYAMDGQGAFGAAAVVASGIPGDDFAIGRDGALFITTHPYDTLVRVGPDGRSTVIGKGAQHIIGATDAVFGTGAADQQTLYVVTDGGAFTAGPGARGQLIAVHPYAKH